MYVKCSNAGTPRKPWSNGPTNSFVLSLNINQRYHSSKGDPFMAWWSILQRARQRIWIGIGETRTKQFTKLNSTISKILSLLSFVTKVPIIGLTNFVILTGGEVIISGCFRWIHGDALAICNTENCPWSQNNSIPNSFAYPAVYTDRNRNALSAGGILFWVVHFSIIDSISQSLAFPRQSIHGAEVGCSRFSKRSARRKCWSSILLWELPRKWPRCPREFV
jgi:hypothetical protein